MQTSETLEKVAEELSKLPSIGRKTAVRIAMYLAKAPAEEVQNLSDALLQLKEKIKLCSVCCNITEEDPCSICGSPKRSESTICIVEEPGDVFAIEKTNEFRGKYHVLHGIISPLDGIGPEDIKVKELLMRLGGEARMNFPGKVGGYWRWRYTPDMLDDIIQYYLREITDLYGRIPSAQPAPVAVTIEMEEA